MNSLIKLLMIFILYSLMINVTRGVTVETSKLEYTTIPLFFGTNMEYQEYSILPPEVRLVRQQLFDEGFSRYVLFVKIENGFNYTKKNDDMIRPVWLSSASDADIESLIRYHPISKSDLQTLIKNSGITRSQLIDILRRWDDEIRK